MPNVLIKISRNYVAKNHLNVGMNIFPQTANLSFRRFLKADFLSLSCPHPIWSCLPGSNPYEVRAARIQPLLLTGRYRTEKLTRHWSGNPNGFCLQASCFNSEKKRVVSTFFISVLRLKKNKATGSPFISALIIIAIAVFAWLQYSTISDHCSSNFWYYGTSGSF